MKALAVVAVICAALTALYVVSYPSASIRYELALEVIVDGHKAGGASVIQVDYRTAPQFLGASSGGSVAIFGEAVQVNLGSGGLLLMLLEHGQHRRSDPTAVVPIAFGVSQGGVGTEDFRRLEHLEGQRELPFDRLPLLVLLRNPSDPSSAVAVDPLRFAAALGPDAELRRATVTLVRPGIWPLTILGLTGTPITRGIRSRLAWLGSEEQRQRFWNAVVSSGGPRNRSVENIMLFTRGD